MHHSGKNFIYVGKVETSKIRSLVENLTSDDWESYTFRQKRYSDHSETKTVPLIWSENFNGVKYWPEYSKFSPVLSEAFSIIEETLGSGIFISAILINLPAGAKIGRHKDRNYNGNRFNLCRRLHIPITTNESCIFEIDGEEMNIKEGEIWEISNVNKMHSVRNDGETDRVHLLIDFAPIDVWEKYFDI